MHVFVHTRNNGQKAGGRRRGFYFDSWYALAIILPSLQQTNIAWICSAKSVGLVFVRSHFTQGPQDCQDVEKLGLGVEIDTSTNKVQKYKKKKRRRSYFTATSRLRWEKREICKGEETFLSSLLIGYCWLIRIFLTKKNEKSFSISVDHVCKASVLASDNFDIFMWKATKQCRSN